MVEPVLTIGWSVDLISGCSMEGDGSLDVRVLKEIFETQTLSNCSGDRLFQALSCCYRRSDVAISFVPAIRLQFVEHIICVLVICFLVIWVISFTITLSFSLLREFSLIAGYASWAVAIAS